MKILFLTHSHIGDRSFGGAMRANSIGDALRASADVETLIIHGGPHYHAPLEWDKRKTRVATLSRYGFSMKAMSERRKLKSWIADIIRLGRYDLIVAQYVALALLVPRGDRERMIFDPDDFLKVAPAGKSQSLPARLKRFAHNFVARRIAREALHVWFSNPSTAQTVPTARKSFLPNVITSPDPARPHQTPVPGRLLMVGLFSHTPNVEGLTWFSANVLPSLVNRVPNCELHVVGRHDPELAAMLPEVRFHGFVDDLATEYDKSSLVIAPIRSGGGTQIKVIDALAHGRPTIASRFAHAGFSDDLHDNAHILVANTVDEWVDRCAWALENAAEAHEIAQRGRKVAEALYGQERVDSSVKQTLRSILPR